MRILTHLGLRGEIHRKEQAGGCNGLLCLHSEARLPAWVRPTFTPGSTQSVFALGSQPIWSLQPLGKLSSPLLGDWQLEMGAGFMGVGPAGMGPSSLWQVEGFQEEKRRRDRWSPYFSLLFIVVKDTEHNIYLLNH